MAKQRYSIIPGDFAVDARADVAHFRVMNLIGRHTDELGWCRLKQLTIGTEIGLTRETVNRKLKDLVEWGYVEKHCEDTTGRAIWYRTIMDRPLAPDTLRQGVGEPDEDNPSAGCETPSGPVRGGSHVGYNTDGENGACTPRGVTAGNHTRCDRTRSQQERPSLNDQVSHPPSPRKRGARVGGVQLLIDEVLARPGRERAVAVLFDPLVRQRSFAAPDRAFALGQLADWTAALPDEVLADALARLLAERKAVVKPADVEAAVKAAKLAAGERAVWAARAEAERRRASEAARDLAAKEARLAADRETLAAIGVALEARGDRDALVATFAARLASPIERRQFRAGLRGSEDWLAPLIRERALAFLAANGVLVGAHGSPSAMPCARLEPALPPDVMAEPCSAWTPARLGEARS